MASLDRTARSFLQLFAYRVGVGVGEATLSPSAYSLLAGHFPPQKLALAVGLFSAGVTAGTGLAYLLGGSVIGWVMSLGSVQLPLLGELSGWRLVMAVVGLLGLPVAVLMVFVREPARPKGLPPATLNEVWAHFTAHAKEYGYVFAGYGTTSITAFAVMIWTPELYRRQYGAGIGEAALAIGTVALIGGLLGGFLGGALSDRLEAGGDRRAKLRVLAACGIGLLLPAVLAPLMPTMIGHAAVISLTFFFGSAAMGPAGAFVQSITPDRMRAQFGACYQLSLVLVGATLGPFAVGFVTDHVFGDEAKIGLSMALVAAVFNPIAAWLLWRAFRLSKATPLVQNL